MPFVILKPVADVAPLVVQPAVVSPPHWWWDAVWLAQAVVFNVLGALLALAAVVYAWRVAKKQFKLADDQGKIIDKQLSILEEHKSIFLRLEDAEKRQEELLTKQTEITKRQGEIAERQDKLLTRRALPYMYFVPRPTSPSRRSWDVNVINLGDKTLNDFYWWLYLPSDIAEDSVVNVGWPSRLDHKQEMSTLAGHDMFVGSCEYRLYPGIEMNLGTVNLRADAALVSLPVRWRLVAEDGAFPENDERLGSIVVEPKKRTPYS